MNYPIFDNILVTITAEQNEWLNKEMNRRRLSKSELIQEAMDLLMKKWERKPVSIGELFLPPE